MPVPNCSGKTVCLQDGFTITAAVAITCDPEQVKGPWTLVLERQVLTDWRVVQVQNVDEPGFGATFNDTKAPKVAHLVYRVCVEDDYGERCGAQFETISAPSCAGCSPFSCIDFRACNTEISNGCGDYITCGPCPNGGTCSARYASCCPAGTEPDGFGGCECAPPHPCPRRYYWEAAHCRCEPIFRPEPL
jgi:hypothetical protein